MKTSLNKAFSGIALVVAALVMSQSLAGVVPQARAAGYSYSGASLNSDPNDFALVQVSNQTRCATGGSCFVNNLTDVRDGDVIAFVIYAHNTGPAAAINTRVRLQVSNVNGGLVGNAVLSADNANTVNGTSRVSFASGVTSPATLEFMGGEYYANSSVDPINPDAFPNGQTAAQVSQNGINIGTLANDYAGQFRNDVQIVVRYKVRSGAVVTPTPTSTTSTPSTGNLSAALNSDPRDFALVQVSNQTRCTGANCFTSTLNGVQNNDVIAFVLYAHNTGPVAAANTRMRLQVNDTTGGIVGNAVLTADNANTVNGVARVNFASGATTPVALEFVGGEYYAKSSVDPFTPDAFPNGSTAAQVSQGGINIGTLANDYAGQFRNDAQVVVRYKVRFAEIENPPLPPDDTNVCTGAAALSLVPTVSTVYPGGVAQYRAIYDSNGACAGGQTDVTNVASWTADNTALATSLGRGVFRGVAAGNTTVRASYGTYGANAALTVRTTTGGTTTTNPRGSYSGGGGSTYTPRTGGSSYNSGTTTTNVPPVTNNPGTTHIYYPKRVANSVR